MSPPRALALLLASFAAVGCSSREDASSMPQEQRSAPPATAVSPAATSALNRGSSASREADESRHLLVTLSMSPESIRVLDARVVAEPLPRLRQPAGPGGDGPWSVEVEDAHGEILFRRAMPASNSLRGEFADGRGRIESVHMQTAEAVFAVRLPLLSTASTIRLRGLASTLPDGDPRARWATEGVQVDLGRVEYPKVAQ